MTAGASSRACLNPLTATRYHSLVVERDTLGDALEVSAWAEDGTVMGIRTARLRSMGSSSILKRC